MDTVEEQVAEVRSEVQKEMELVRSELQCLAPLEKTVETLLGRMSTLDHMDRWLQKVEGPDLPSLSSRVTMVPSVAPSVPEVVDRGKEVVPTASESL